MSAQDVVSAAVHRAHIATVSLYICTKHVLSQVLCTERILPQLLCTEHVFQRSFVADAYFFVGTVATLHKTCISQLLCTLSLFPWLL